MKLSSKKHPTLARRPKRDIPADLWTKCDSCAELIYNKALEENLGVCPKCDFHFAMAAGDRIALTLDDGTLEEWDSELTSGDPLTFRVPKPYPDKIAEERARVGMTDACITGTGRIEGHPIVLGVISQFPPSESSMWLTRGC